MSGYASKQRADQISGGVFMIGLAILFFTGNWWPGILFVIGASTLARGMAEGRAWYSVQGALWMIGLGLVFWFGFSLPLLLVVIGLSMLFGYRYRPPFAREDSGGEIEGQSYSFSDTEPARKVKNADGLAYYDEEIERELAFEEDFDLLHSDEDEF